MLTSNYIYFQETQFLLYNVIYIKMQLLTLEQ